MYVWDGSNLAYESETDTYYLYGTSLFAAQDGTDERYYLFNGHGDVVGLAGSTGTVTKNYDYDAYGNEKDIDETDQNPLRYCGEYYDSETGTYYLRARYYNPVIGRFTSEDTHWNPSNMIYGDEPIKIGESKDPLGIKHYTYKPNYSSIRQSYNLYPYCLNNPLFFIDISGEFGSPLSWALAVIAGMTGVYLGIYLANK